MSEMNARLEIASRLMAALFDFTGEPKGHAEPTPPHMALIWADALIAEEARTRPKAEAFSATDDLRAVAEELVIALDHACEWLANDHDRVHVAGENALARARALGLDEVVALSKPPAPDDTPRQTVAERALCGLKQLADDVEDSIKTGKTLVQVKGKPHLVPAKVADEIAELRAVAEEMFRALAANDARADDSIGPAAYEEALVRLGWNKIESVIRFERRLTTEALKRARAIGLGGGK